MELLKVDTLEEARAKLKKTTKNFEIDIETVSIDYALGRVLGEDIVSKEALPDFRKSTVDGYAVLSKDTQGVTESIPMFLDIIEEVDMGKSPKKEIVSGTCAYVPTGGMVPKGADAMVMVEHCENFNENSIAVYDSVSFGRNIINIGEDVEKADLIIKKGKVLRPQEIATLAALGYKNVKVFKPLKITVISTGDELVSLDEKLEMGQVRDINTYAICAQGKENGFEIVEHLVLKDNEELLTKALTKGMKESHMVVISGGSSQGKKDITAKVIHKESNPGVFTHGISLKPGKPTILGYDEESKTVLIGLPGHPSAAMMVFQLIAIHFWKSLTEQPKEKEVVATMDTNVAGGGRTICLLVALEDYEEQYIAKPILGKSGLITTMTKADGYTIIPQNKEGLKKGEKVKVKLF